MAQCCLSRPSWAVPSTHAPIAPSHPASQTAQLVDSVGETVARASQTYVWPLPLCLPCAELPLQAWPHSQLACAPPQRGAWLRPLGFGVRPQLAAAPRLLVARASPRPCARFLLGPACPRSPLLWEVGR